MTPDGALPVALELFLAHGFDNTPLRLVAETSGVTTASLRYRYPRRELLLAQLAEPLLADLDALVADLGDDATTAERRTAALTAYLGVLLRHRSLARLVIGDSAVRRTSVGERLAAQQRQLMARLAGRRAKVDVQVRVGCALALLRLAVVDLATVPVERLREPLLHIAIGAVPVDTGATSTTVSGRPFS